MILPDATDVDITQQDVLVGVGRGIQQEDNLEVAEQLAQALGGVLAASRPIVDQGWLPTTRQVGKSGMTVKPKCFFALGISGAPEHVEGMKDSGLIIAVNTDPNAPIFDVAHYGVVADLLDVAPAPDRRRSRDRNRENPEMRLLGQCSRLLASLPTSEKFFGVYGAVWLILLVAIASAVFAWRMFCLLRVLTRGRWENRLDHPVERLGMFIKEVMLQSRMWTGESIINWAHPLIFWGFCCFVAASARCLDVHRRDARSLPAGGWHVPQAEEIPVLGTIVDVFAVLVFVALVASSIRRYILTPPGLQRTWDASIVVSLIAALMVTFRVGGSGRTRAAQHGRQWGGAKRSGGLGPNVACPPAP